MKSDLFEAIYTARALRRLKPDPVPDEVITKVLDAAIRAPSASNTQNWAFVVVKNPEQRGRVAEIYRQAWKMMQTMYRERRPASHQSPAGYKKMMGAADHLAHHLQEVPVMIVAGLMTPQTPGFQPPAEHAAAVASAGPRISGVSIYPCGADSCLPRLRTRYGSDHDPRAYFNDEVRAVLGLPPEFATYAVLPIGYPMEGFLWPRTGQAPAGQ